MAKDALHAPSMNVHPGGKQPYMRPGWFKRGPVKFIQHMVFMDGPNKGLQKGLRAVCQERFGEQAVIGESLIKKEIKKNLRTMKRILYAMGPLTLEFFEKV